MPQFLSNTQEYIYYRYIDTLGGLRRSVGHVSWAELSGCLGDLGTFLPLVVALTQEVGLDLGTTLLFTGVYNIVTGLMFDIPMPVQPMKTIAAVALSGDGLTIPQIMAAGIFVSACVLVLGAAGLMGIATRLTPPPVIRGMQLGVGLALSQKGFKYVWYRDGASSEGMNSVWGLSGIFVGMFFIIFILLSVYNTRDANSDEVSRPTEGGASQQQRVVDQENGGEERGEGSVPVSVTVKEDTKVVTETDFPSSSMASQSPGDITLVSSSNWMGNGTAYGALSKIREVIEKYLLRPLYICGDKAGQACGEVKYDVQLQKTCCSGIPPSSGRHIPAALIILVVGIILSISFNPSIVNGLSMGPSKPDVIVPTGEEWKSGILRAGLPQLPLTTLNSVISVTQLANEWFPDRYSKPGSVATSVGLMNLVGCWFGAMPSCHGAGGLAAQVRFGARWGTAPVILGVIKIFLGLLFGSSLLNLLQEFPLSMLGAMLVFSGIELASVAKGQKGERGMAIMLLTAAIGLATGNISIGVAVGLACAYIVALWDHLLMLASAQRWPIFTR
ncbi:hypothetical protein M9435_004991 [Picochlorum sp. BPE23]|nr:hypothetical protein M9435_004991 [Picochlorum sp. BPE23]